MPEVNPSSSACTCLVEAGVDSSQLLIPFVLEIVGLVTSDTFEHCCRCLLLALPHLGPELHQLGAAREITDQTLESGQCTSNGSNKQAVSMQERLNSGCRNEPDHHTAA